MIDADLGDQRDLPIVALLPRDAGNRCSRPVSDHREAGMQRIAGVTFEHDAGLRRRSRHRRSHGAKANRNAGLGQRGVDCRLQRAI